MRVHAHEDEDTAPRRIRLRGAQVANVDGRGGVRHRLGLALDEVVEGCEREVFGDDVVTAGIGLSPWDVFHLDITGMVGEETYGANVQMSWTF